MHIKIWDIHFMIYKIIMVWLSKGSLHPTFNKLYLFGAICSFKKN